MSSDKAYRALKERYCVLERELAAAQAQRKQFSRRRTVDRRILEMCREIDAAKLATAQEGVTAWAEKLLEDAERYRWLRARPVEDCTTPRIEVNAWTCNVNDDGVSDSINEGNVLAGDALDAAIDKAMLGEKE